MALRLYSKRKGKNALVRSEAAEQLALSGFPISTRRRRTAPCFRQPRRFAANNTHEGGYLGRFGKYLVDFPIQPCGSLVHENAHPRRISERPCDYYIAMIICRMQSVGELVAE